VIRNGILVPMMATAGLICEAVLEKLNKWQTCGLVSTPVGAQYTRVSRARFLEDIVDVDIQFPR
jgi:hypothetical protein